MSDEQPEPTPGMGAHIVLTAEAEVIRSGQDPDSDNSAPGEGDEKEQP